MRSLIYLVWTFFNCQANSFSGVPRLSSAKAFSARAKNSRSVALAVWPPAAPDRLDIQFGQALWILEILADDVEDVWGWQVWQVHPDSLLVLQELGAALLDE